MYSLKLFHKILPDYFCFKNMLTFAFLSSIYSYLALVHELSSTSISIFMAFSKVQKNIFFSCFSPFREERRKNLHPILNHKNFTLKKAKAIKTFSDVLKSRKIYSRMNSKCLNLLHVLLRKCGRRDIFILLFA